MERKVHGVRFLVFWRGREPGQIDRQLDYGVMHTLVTTGRAVWCDPATDAAIENVAVSPESEAVVPSRRSRKRES